MEKHVFSAGIENTYSLDSLFIEENLKNKDSGKKYYKRNITTKNVKEVGGPSGKKAKRPKKKFFGCCILKGVLS